MKDHIKAWLALLFFALALILPLFSLATGWLAWDGRRLSIDWPEWNWRTLAFEGTRWDWRIGVSAAAFTFAVCFVLGLWLALRVDAPNWAEILLPFATGIGYSVLNVIPLPFDDFLVTAAGAVASYTMALKRYTDAPRWIIAPPLVAAAYTLLGEFIPGPVDELAVSMVAALISSFAAARSGKRVPTQEELVEIEAEEVEAKVALPPPS
jgi:hypothetical protein